MHHLGPVIESMDLIAKQQVFGDNVVSQHILGQLCLAILPHRTKAFCCLQDLQLYQVSFAWVPGIGFRAKLYCRMAVEIHF